MCRLGVRRASQDQRSLAGDSAAGRDREEVGHRGGGRSVLAGCAGARPEQQQAHGLLGVKLSDDNPMT